MISAFLNSFLAFCSSMMWPASIVLPRPTSSATKMRLLSELRNFNKGLNWYALKSVFDALSEEIVLTFELRILKVVLILENSLNEPYIRFLQRSNGSFIL